MNENELQIFSNPEFGQMRTVAIGGEPWFVSKDVAVALGYEKPRNAISDHVDDEDKKMGPENGAPSIKDSLGREQYPVFINESGLYSLILSSKLPKAKKFKHWVTAEVLPRIRKTGSYNVKQEQKPLSQLEILQGSINQLIEQNKRLSRVEMKQEEQDKQMGYINTSIEVLNGVCTEGTKRERLNQMVRAYANKAGLTYAKAWHKFREAFNVAFHTSIGLLIAHYTQKNSLKKKPSVPEYLEATERIDDALRVIEKMLNELPRQAAS